MSTQRKVRSPVGYREALMAAMLNGAYGEGERARASGSKPMLDGRAR